MKEMIIRFCRILEAQAVEYASLLEQTLRERETLCSRQAGAIGTCLRQKEELLVRISELDHQRLECLRFFARFFDESMDDMTFSFLIEAIEEPLSTRLAAVRGRLREVTGLLKEENIRNGMLAGRMYEHAWGRGELLKNIVNAANGLYTKAVRKDVCHSVTG